MKKFSGNIIDIINKKIFPGTIIIENEKIYDIIRNNIKYNNYILPGFIDAHIHIESSMLLPSEFARIAIQHGTIGTVSDPHEIANVLGIKGIELMINNAKNIPFYFYFSAPSCVPASNFETNGATLSHKNIEYLFKKYNLKYLGEMMNFPGVINNNREVIKKINIAKKYNKKIDGHAPGLIGKDLDKYINTGIDTDHETLNLIEAKEKLLKGMNIILRSGSAANNFEELLPIIKNNPNKCMFCSDDKHPDDLIKGHINLMVKKAIHKGYNIFDILKIACINPIKHYSLDIGTLNINDSADFIIIDNLRDFNIQQTIIKGNIVYKNNKVLIKRKKTIPINNFNIKKKNIKDFYFNTKNKRINIIIAYDKQLFTNMEIIKNRRLPDKENDILKIAVINRYKNSKPSIGFIKGFGLQDGAIASSISHDSHNIIVIGTNDYDICKAVNLIIRNKGGLSVYSKKKNFSQVLKLPIAGIMSNNNYKYIAKKYTQVDLLSKKLGSKLSSPFMTMSFMALTVIPEIKISDKGIKIFK